MEDRILKLENENNVIKNELNQVKYKLDFIIKNVNEIKHLSNNLNEIIPIYLKIYINH